MMRKRFLLMVILMILVVPLRNVFAADLTIAKDGFDGVGEIEVQVQRDKFLLSEAKSQNNITLNGDFQYLTSTAYTDSQFEDGTFDSQRNDANVVTYGIYEASTPVIAYKKPLPVGVNRIPGSIVVKFEKAGILQDGTLCDITMTLDNITIKNGHATTKPVLMVYGNNNVSLGAAYAKQEVTASNLNSKHQLKYTDIGSSYDISFVVTKAGSSEVIAKNMGISFVDIDIKDKTVNPEAYEDANGRTNDYVESITLINGVNDKIHMTSGSILKVDNTSYGSNTRFSGTREDEGTEDSGFITLVSANSFKMNWTGSSCGTVIGFISTNKVITSTSGQYKDNVKITPTDNKVFWKENKTITMTPDKGYSVSQITIDGVVIDYINLKLNADGTRTYTNDGVTYVFHENNGVVTYTFNSVVKDHKIDVQVTKTLVNPNTGMFISAAFIGLILCAIVGFLFYFNIKKKLNKGF